MNASRVLRTTRCVRSPSTRIIRRDHFQRRFQSSGQSGANASSSSPALVGSIAGGITAFACCYGWYHFSGMKTVMTTAQETKKYVDAAKKNIQENAPSPNEALQWLRQTVSSYAAFVPGASGAIDTAFDELDTIHDSHKEEVDAIISDCYNDLKKVSQKGLSAETIKEGSLVISKHLGRIYELASDTMGEMLDRHPELKEKLGKPANQLKQMGDKLGPEAKKIVDDAWTQASKIATSGGSVMSAENIDRIKKIIQDATERVRKLGDEAWDKAMQSAKPYLDKNPQIKKLVDENMPALKQGNIKQLVQKIKDATDNGNMGDLEDFVRNAADKAQSGGMGGLKEYVEKLPKGDEFLSNLGKLQDAAQNHGKEAEELFKSTLSELSQVLSKKVEEAKNLKNKAERDTK